MMSPRIRITAIAAALFFTAQVWAQNPSNPIQVALLRWYQANQTAQFSGDGSCTGPNGLAFDGAHVWVACSTANEIQELNASDGTLLKTIKSNTQLVTPEALLFDGANIWVSNGSTSAGAVTKVNASTGAYGSRQPTHPTIPTQFQKCNRLSTLDA
jgi:sugar lactone lactonase YvrE